MVARHSSGRILLAYANRHWLLAFRRNGSDWRATAGNPESAFISIAIIYHHKFRKVRGDSVTFLRRRGTHYSKMARNSVKRIVNFLEYLELVVWHIRSKLTRDIKKRIVSVIWHVHMIFAKQIIEFVSVESQEVVILTLLKAYFYW